mmetsp:Transcript_97690/g.273370  ORF Transcript_97690/g.273370 Transcript_97690/m.273370 type:complete len:328 (-) Transcript_97690:107-1090(-)
MALGFIDAEQVQGVIDSTPYPDELLRIWVEKERNALRREGGALEVRDYFTAEVSEFVPHAARGAAVWFLAHLAHFIGTSFTQCVELLDLYIERAAGSPQLLEQLPETTVAIASIVFKFRNTSTLQSFDHAFGQAERGLAQWLEQYGHIQAAGERQARCICDDSGSKEAVERKVMQVLRWQVDLPSVEMWMQAYAHRLDIVSQNLLGDCLEVIMEQGAILAAEVMNHVAVHEIWPQRLARGLICQGLHAAGALHVDLERFSADLPGGVPLSDGLLPASSWWGKVPQCMLPEQFREGMLELLMVALGADRGRLEQDLVLSSIAVRVKRC